MSVTSEVLVLNAFYKPISIISAKKAILLILKNRAEVVEGSNETISTVAFKMKVPTVISVHYNYMPKKRVKFSKLNVLYRDDQTCAYCGKRFPINKLTIDHVIPVSKWHLYNKDAKRNATSWTNCVCACEHCNTKKGSKLLSELGWRLRIDPKEPLYMPYFIITRKKAELKGWLPYCSYNVRIVDQIE